MGYSDVAVGKGNYLFPRTQDGAPWGVTTRKCEKFQRGLGRVGGQAFPKPQREWMGKKNRGMISQGFRKKVTLT